MKKCSVGLFFHEFHRHFHVPLPILERDVARRDVYLLSLKELS